MAESYKVVASTDLARFVERCNHETDNGYEPIGGMVIKGESTRVEYFQSFILTSPKRSPGRPKKEII
jgi:hypothetical protein